MAWLFERTIEYAAWILMIVSWVSAVLMVRWLLLRFGTHQTGADHELLRCSVKAAGAFVGYSAALGALAWIDRFIFDVDDTAA